jgi:hypothetical protein
MRRGVVAAPFTLVALLLIPISSVSAGNRVNFRHSLNTLNNAYLAFQSLVDTHNSFVRRHHSNCPTEQKAKWSSEVHRYVVTVRLVGKKLARVTGKQRKLRSYHDLVQTARDLQRWTTTRAVPQLRKCMSKRDWSYAVERDLVNDDDDLRPLDW